MHGVTGGKADLEIVSQGRATRWRTRAHRGDTSIHRGAQLPVCRKRALAARGGGCCSRDHAPVRHVRWCNMLSAISLLKESNDIALIVASYKPQTVVYSLYGKRGCLLAGLNGATAALWPGSRSSTGRNRPICRS